MMNKKLRQIQHNLQGIFNASHPDITPLLFEVINLAAYAEKQDERIAALEAKLVTEDRERTETDGTQS